MKEKIIFLIIGVLIGAIIATSGLLIYSKTSSNNKGTQPEMMQMDSNNQIGNPPSGDMGTPPEKPDGNNGQEPPAKPGEATSNQDSNN